MKNKINHATNVFRSMAIRRLHEIYECTIKQPLVYETYNSCYGRSY